MWPCTLKFVRAYTSHCVEGLVVTGNQRSEVGSTLFKFKAFNLESVVLPKEDCGDPLHHGSVIFTSSFWEPPRYFTTNG